MHDTHPSANTTVHCAATTGSVTAPVVTTTLLRDSAIRSAANPRIPANESVVWTDTDNASRNMMAGGVTVMIGPPTVSTSLQLTIAPDWEAL
jgi:hypothetical protein